MASYITLDQAKDHLRVDFTDDDIYIQCLMDVAETAILNEIRGQVTSEGTVTTAGTTTLTGDGTTFTDYKAGDVIKVEGETSTRIIASITSDTVLLVTVAFSSSDSGLTYTLEPTAIVSGALPKPIYQAMLLLIGQLYENREPVVIGSIATKLPFSLEYLLAPYKTWVVK